MATQAAFRNGNQLIKGNKTNKIGEVGGKYAIKVKENIYVNKMGGGGIE